MTIVNYIDYILKYSLVLPMIIVIKTRLLIFFNFCRSICPPPHYLVKLDLYYFHIYFGFRLPWKWVTTHFLSQHPSMNFTFYKGLYSNLCNYKVQRYFIKGYRTIDEKSGQNISIGFATNDIRTHGSRYSLFYSSLKDHQ